ncbi:MAG: hypothetical protein IPI88_05320 [Chitinophagaceae bacterium]|nr:hypothetical protein [Chitinophagaceae bacterium]
MSVNLHKIDYTWTLFLDRDGVINHEKHLDYIHTWDEFAFYEGVTEAIAVFAKTFHRIVVVTNQKELEKRDQAGRPSAHSYKYGRCY